MKIISSHHEISIRIQVTVSEGLPQEIGIDIGNNWIIFRAKGIQTDRGVPQAKLNPQIIANSVYALLPDIYDYECEAVVKLIIGLI